MTRVAVRLGLALAVVWTAVAAGARVVGEWLPGEEIAFAASPAIDSYEFDIFGMDIDRNMVFNLTRQPAFDSHPRWSPDGTQIAFLSSQDGQQRLYLMNADRNNLRQLTTVDVTMPEWSPDGRRIALLASDGNTYTVHIIDVVSGEMRQINDFRALLAPVHWSPDGTRVAFSTVHYQTVVVDVFTGAIQMYDGSYPTWSPNSDRAVIAYRSRPRRILFIHDLQTDTLTPISVHDEIVTEASWSPDGSQLAFVMVDGTNRHIHIVNSDGTNVRAFDNHSTSDFQLIWLRTGQSILFLDATSGFRTLSTLDLETGDVYQLPANYSFQDREPLSIRPRP